MNKLSFWLRFDVWLVVATAVYTMLVFSDMAMLAAPLGMFVPIGPLNFLFVIMPGLLGTGVGDASALSLPGNEYMLMLLAVLIYAAFLFCGERVLRKFNRSVGAKVAVNLLVLGSLTFLIDILTVHTWGSALLLLNAFGA